MGVSEELDRTIKSEVGDIVEEQQRTIQAIFDRLVAEHGGEPVEACIKHVRAAFEEAELIPDDDNEILEYAVAVSAGEQIEVSVESNIHW